MTTKTPNYTDEVTASMVEKYRSGLTDEARLEICKELATLHGRKIGSIRAKLVREGVYIAVQRLDKSGHVAIQKSELVEMIASAIGMTSENLPGLERAGKETLRHLAEACEHTDIFHDVATDDREASDATPA